MQTKIYRAKTIKEATARVKNSLGPDAMIISTKRLRGKGENDLFEISAVPGGTETYNKISNPFSEVNAQLMSIKEMMILLNHSDSTIENLMMNPAALSLYAKLIREGVDDHYARNILERTGAFKEGFQHLQTIMCSEALL